METTQVMEMMQVEEDRAPAFPWRGPAAVFLGASGALIARWVFAVPAAMITAFCLGGIFTLAVVLLVRRR